MEEWRNDGAQVMTHIWPSDHINGRYQPATAKDIHPEPIFFEAYIGPTIPKEGKNYYRSLVGNHIIDVRLVDQDGRTFARRDGGPTQHQQPWQDPLSTGLINTADLLNKETDKEPEITGGPEQVRIVERERVQQGKFHIPLLTSPDMALREAPPLGGDVQEAMGAIWELWRWLGNSISAQTEPDEGQGEQIEKVREHTVVPYLTHFQWIHRARVLKIEFLPALNWWHSSLARSRGMLHCYNYQPVWLSAYTGVTFNHGPCASDRAMKLHCVSSWGGRINEMKGHDWNCTQNPCPEFSPEPLDGQCGSSPFLYIHVCNDDTRLQDLDIQKNVYHQASSFIECNNGRLTAPLNCDQREVEKETYQNLSKRSLSALHTGHLRGGCSRAHR